MNQYFKTGCRMKNELAFTNRGVSIFLVGLFAVVFVFMTVGCSPKVYVIDNQTVLEEEAAGQWPQFEKQIIDKAKAKGPTPISQVPLDAHRERLYNVMNGEMPLTSKSVAQP